MKKKKRNRSRLYILFIAVLLIWFFNNMTLKKTSVEISSEKINSDVKIAVISDLHYDKVHVSTSAIRSAIKKGSPNMLFVLGDMYSSGSDTRIITAAADFIISLTEICPVYFVPGEHDRDTEYLEKLRDSCVNVMDYQYQTVWIDKNEIKLYGIDNVYFSKTFDLHNEFDSPDESIYNILLAHIPKYEEYQKFGTDLTVCGDTHGGIVQFPILGCAYYEGKWFPELFHGKDGVYDRGLFSGENGYMFITSGLGNNPVPARFCNRPEVAFITLSPDKKGD